MPALQRLLTHAPGAAALWAAAVGALVLAGWVLDIAVLKSVVRGFATMKASAALGFILAGAALWTLRKRRLNTSARRFANACAAAVGVIGLLTLLEFVFGWQLHIDPLLFLDSRRGAETAAPGRMAPASTFGFVLFGLAALLVDRPAARKLWPSLALAVLGVGVFAVVGYFYHLTSLDHIPAFTTMALHTSLTFVVLATGLLCARPESELVTVLTSSTADGLAVRRLLPVTLVAPLLLGWVGLAGQQRGLYNAELAMAFMAVSSGIVVSAVVWRRARALQQTGGERGRNEEAVGKSQVLFRQLFESSPDGVLLVKADGKIAVANRQVAALFGYDADELTGQPLEVLVPERFRAAHVRMREGYAAAPTLRPMGGRGRELFALRRDGTEFPVEITLSPVDTEDGAMTLSVLRDITERKGTETVLRQARERLARAVAAGNVGLWDWDLRTNLVYFSPEWKRQIGYEEHEISDGLSEWQSRVHPDDLGEALRCVQAYLSGAAPAYEVEFRFRHKNNSYRHILARGSKLAGSDGTPLRLLGTHVDITERTQLQTQFLQAQKMESVGQLAGGMAHDFNNLLTVINGITELVLLDVKAADPLHADLLQIRGAADRAVSLIRQLLAFSRKQFLKPVVLDLNSVVSDMRPMIERLIGEDINLVIKPAKGLRSVSADPAQIEQVVMNLAVNARDAMPVGGALTIETQNVELDAAYALEHPSVEPGPHVVLAVGDTGVGMDEATRRRIFEPYFTTKGSARGTGLGLSTVYGIVKQSGGSIWVYSEPGRGTMFKIYLPEVEGAAAHQARPARTALAAGGTETILIVEDDAAVRRLARRFLQSGGYTVITAGNGAEALKLLARRDGPVHLMLTDVVMPGMSGRDLAAHLANIRPGTNVLYTSGHTEDAILRHGVINDATHFIGKPYTRAELTRKVREVLDSSDLD